MNDARPISDPATHYRIEVRGQVDADWLQSFDRSAEIKFCETQQMDEITVLDLCTDQAGMVSLVRRLHGLGMAIPRLEII